MVGMYIPEQGDDPNITNQYYDIAKAGTLESNGFPKWTDEMLESLPTSETPMPDCGIYTGMWDIIEFCDYIEYVSLCNLTVIKLCTILTDKDRDKMVDLFQITQDWDNEDVYEWIEEPVKFTRPDGTEGTVVRRYQEWKKITKETAFKINEIPC